MKRLAALTLVTLSLSGLPAFAAESTEKDAVATANAEMTVNATPEPVAARSLSPAEWVAANRRPAPLTALQASFAALQLFDAYSTNKAIAGGAHEANPLMQSVVGNRAMFWTVKAAATVGPMLAAERLWKKNKVAAIAVMAISNGVMAGVAMHNASVIKAQR